MKTFSHHIYIEYEGDRKQIFPAMFLKIVHTKKETNVMI